jgi:hypothetical protein
MGDQGKRQRAAADVKAAVAQGDGVDQAFDLWLTRGLHQLYDQVAKEPLPEELLRLIEEDRLRGAARSEDEQG